VNEFTFERLISGDEKPLFSFFPFYQVNLVDESKFVLAIEGVRHFGVAKY
jgi:hypothetical protein